MIISRKGIYYVNFLGRFHSTTEVLTMDFLTRTLQNLKIATADTNYIMLTFLSVLFSLFLVQSGACGQSVSTSRQAVNNSAKAGQNIAIEYPAAVKILASKRAFMEMLKLHQQANDLRAGLVAEGFNKNYVKNTYGWKVHDSEVAKKVAEMEMDFYRKYPGVELGGATALLKKYDFTRSREYGANLYCVQEVNNVIKHAHNCRYLPDMVFNRLSNLLKKFYSSRLKFDKDKTYQIYQSLIELLEDRGL